MNKSAIWLGTALVAAVLLGVVIYSHNSRFYLQSAGDGVVYKIDRRTGRTWRIIGSNERLVTPKQFEQIPK